MATTDNQLRFNSLLEEWGRNQIGTDVVLTLNRLVSDLSSAFAEHVLCVFILIYVNS